MSDSLKVSVSGIRGIIGESLTPDLISSYTGAFASWLKRGRIAVGGDTRPSGAMVSRVVIGELLARGIDVVDIGICPTPTLMHYVRANKLDGGIIISASHNPAQWNALKLVKQGGVFIDAADFAALDTLIKGKMPPYCSVELLGSYTLDEGAVDFHIDHLIKQYDIKLIKMRKFSVAVDPGNGAGAVMSRKFLNRLGCIVSSVHEEPHGIFGREPEPRAGVLDDLSRTVKENKCVVGFAQDPDADRLTLVDENGVQLSEELTLALSVRSFFESKKTGPVVINASTSALVEHIARPYLAPVFRSAVGEANVLAEMQRVKAAIGGEGNGGVMYPFLNGCRDSFVGMLLVLDLMARSKKPLSRIIDELPPLVMRKEKIAVSGTKNIESLLRKALQDGEHNFTVETVDGVRFACDAGWLHVRESNTEPVIRIIAEAETAALVDKWIGLARKALA